MDKVKPHLKALGFILMELAIYVILVAIIGGSLAALMNLIIKPSVPTSDSIIGDPYKSTLTEFLPLLIGSIVALVIQQKIFKRNWNLTGIVRQRWLKEFGQGYLLAFLLLAVGFLILWATGMIKITGTDANPYLFIGFAILFIIQSSFEEVVCRSFMISAFAWRTNLWIALILSSLLFAFMHLGNPNMSPIAMINLLLAGLLMGLCYIYTQRIWIPIGLHAGWNFLQGSFFGFEVSGLEVYSFINQTEKGPDLLTGGGFGYEGSLFALLSLAAACAFFFRIKPDLMSDTFWQRESSDMEAITSME